MVMNRPMAPLATARAPGSEFTLPGMIRSGSSTSRIVSVMLLQAGAVASSAMAASVATVRPPNRDAFRICIGLGERLEDEIEAEREVRRRSKGLERSEERRVGKECRSGE